MLDTKAMQEVVAIDKEMADLKAQQEKLKARRAELQDHIIENMADNGIDNIKIAGRTIFIRRSVWMSATHGKQAVIDALEKAKMGEYITVGYNYQSLSAFVREQEKMGEDLPKEFENAITSKEKFEVRTVKS